MKKFLAILLALTMVLGMSVMVSADGGNGNGEEFDITFVKKVAGGGNPEETFDFKVIEKRVVEGSATVAPDLGNFSITVAKGAAQGTVGVNLPNFTQVGRYEYDIKETAGSTAGMVYDETVRTLVVIVTNKQGGGFDYHFGMKIDDKNKSQDFTVANNKFLSGDLIVKKVIEGNLADPGDVFEIKVTLSLPEGSELDFKTDGIDWGDYTTIAEDGKSATYTLKGNEDFTIQNIPEGVSYKVEELNAEDFTPIYEVTYTEEEGSMTEDGATATITNTRGTAIETGISLDNLPYIMTMVLALGGLVLFVVRKRRFN